MRTLTIALALLTSIPAFAQTKSKITFDEFFNSVSFSALELSPDGNSVVIGTERADWDKQIFRKDLWLYRVDGQSGSLLQLTQSGHDTDPKWSPDGKWIAFLSDRKTEKDSSDDSGDDDADNNEDVDQIYLISPSGGEAFPITDGAEEVHDFAWSADSKTLYYATRNPWTKAQKDEYRKEWKDVEQYRTAERGDTIFDLTLDTALAHHRSAPAKTKNESDSDKESDLTAGARAIATSPWRMDELVTSPDGTKLALMANPINRREEKYEDYEIYLLDLANGQTTVSDRLAQPRRITHNQAVENDLQWASDSRHLLFRIDVGDVTGPYRDLQPHLYSVDTASGSVEQWAKEFGGPVDHYVVTADGILSSARLGTEVQMYSDSAASQPFHKISNWKGTFEDLSIEK
ncbi:MAG TPA: hypothetical protein VH596_14310, partial [Terriglobales bacterium]